MKVLNFIDKCLEVLAWPHLSLVNEGSHNAALSWKLFIRGPPVTYPESMKRRWRREGLGRERFCEEWGA